MENMICDTSPEAERIQIELLRQAGPTKRFSIMCSLSETVNRMSMRAIQKANPDMSQIEVKLRFVALHYGSGLADKLRDYVEERPECKAQMLLRH